MKMNIRALRKKLKGWTQAELAEATGLSQPYIGAIESENIDKSPSTQTLVAISKALGVRVGDLFADGVNVAVVGRVGAGAHVPLIDAYEKGAGMYEVKAPAGLISPTELVGVEVEGDSMVPVYQDGHVLFYTRNAFGVPSEALGRICVCEDEGGDAWVKHVKAGSEPGVFHLISLNPIAENRFDVKLKWAAPVIVAWPRDLIETV